MQKHDPRGIGGITDSLKREKKQKKNKWESWKMSQRAEMNQRCVQRTRRTEVTRGDSAPVGFLEAPTARY